MRVNGWQTAIRGLVPHVMPFVQEDLPITTDARLVTYLVQVKIAGYPPNLSLCSHAPRMYTSGISQII